jgi:hypothetical protein
LVSPFEAGGVLLVAGGVVVGAAQTKYIGPILAFVGALLVVFITAVTTNRRQARQLASEGDRHRESLKAEGDRLQERLQQDRRLSDIQHLREFLDAMAAAYEQASSSCERLSTALAINDEDEDGTPRRGETVQEARASDLRIGTELHRLEMRFAPTDPVFAEYASARKRVGGRFRRLIDIWLEGKRLESGGEEWNADVRSGTEAGKAFERFAAAARREIGVQEAKAGRR